MSRIPYLPGTSKVLLFWFDFRTRIVHVFIIFHNRMYEAEGFRKTFDPLEVFPWIKSGVDPDREVTYLVLDCKCSDDKPLGMDALAGLLKLMTNVDPSSLRYTVQGHEGSPWAPFGWDDIDFIAVYALLQEKYFPFIEDDKLVIKIRKESDQKGFDDGYTSHGGGRPERKTKKKRQRKKNDREHLPETEGPEPGFVPGRTKEHLSIVKPVTKREGESKKRHKTPKDILKYLKTKGVKKSTVLLFKATHKASWYSHSTNLWVWHQKRHKLGRWCTCGNERLMGMTGLSKNVVGSGLKELKAIGVIFKRAHGRKGVTNTIWELALNMRHVNDEKRNPKRWK